MEIESLLKSVNIKNVAKTKAIMIGSGVILGGVLIFVVVRKIKKASERKGDVADGKRYDVVDRSDDVNSVPIKTNNLTLSEGDAILISQNLLTAMDKWGSDEEAIYDQLNRCETRDDLLLIIRKFGVKPYSGTGVAANWLTRTGFKNLNGWLRAELSKKETVKVKAIYDKLNVPF